MQTNAKEALKREIELAEWMVMKSRKEVVGGNSAMLSAYTTYGFLLDSLRRIEKAMHEDEFPVPGCPF